MNPEDLNIEAEQLLSAAGYLWDPALYAFRRKRNPGQQTAEEYFSIEACLD
jgi:hypothetical protein